MHNFVRWRGKFLDTVFFCLFPKGPGVKRAFGKPTQGKEEGHLEKKKKKGRKGKNIDEVPRKRPVDLESVGISKPAHKDCEKNGGEKKKNGRKKKRQEVKREVGEKYLPQKNEGADCFSQ